MKNSRKFSLKKQPSLGAAATPSTNSDQTTFKTTNPIPNKPLFSSQFPTSPQSNVREELLYVGSHPQHPLARVSALEPFKCSGCKENGAGKRICCQKCDFQLHEFCALSPINSVLNYHPLHAQHQLLFHTKPGKGGMAWPKCDVCGKATKGFTFRCHACSFQIHPCCAMLSTEMNFSIHPHPLKLLPSISTGSDSSTFPCDECRCKQSGSRMYACTVCNNYYLHALCAKNVINGLQAHGIKPSPVEKPSKLGTAARAATVAIIDFVGGLIEGLGEGLGEAISQNVGPDRNITRGVDSRNNANTRRKPATK